jgi:hypothetical protein
MKRILLLSLLIFGYFGYSQDKKERPILPIDSATGKIFYKGVVNVDSVSKQELYLRAREWFVNSFKQSNSVIQMDDKESGTIIGKGNTSISVNSMFGSVEYGFIRFTVSVYIKDGKYKYSFTDFKQQDWRVGGSPNSGVIRGDLGNVECMYNYDCGYKMSWTRKGFNKILNDLNDTILDLISSLGKSMSSSAKKDEW